jgi:hypothetical protein
VRTVISASRRTDIPGFYMPWLEARIAQGYVDVQNPVCKGKTYRVSLLPGDVHTMVLWSKNFQPFFDSPLSRRTKYRWYFNFSLVDCPVWEPGVLPLEDRMRQMKELCRRWSPEHINWRFDPIIYWDQGKRTNADSFFSLCDFCAELGIRRCTFSFVSWYPKVKQRVTERRLSFFDPPTFRKIEIIQQMVAYARERNMSLASCCCDEVEGVCGVSRARCVDGWLLTELAGERCSFAQDRSQRSSCGCTKSSDIGNYEMSCPHRCVYCYARPLNR